MNELEKIASEFARAVDQVTKRSHDLELEDVIQLYDDVETHILPKVSEDDLARIEFKRRIAESKLYLLIEHDRPFEDVILYYYAACELEFADLEMRVTVGIIFAKYCLRNDYVERGTELLKQLYNALNDALAANDLELYRHLIKVVENTLGRNMS